MFSVRVLKSNLPGSEQAADQTLALPVAPEINQQEWVAAKILNFFLSQATIEDGHNPILLKH